MEINTDLALLIVRLVVGVLMMGHGAQKLLGWFGGHGLAGTTGWLESMGLRPAGLWALSAGVAEMGGGLLLALGLLTPLGAIGVGAAMLMAILLVHGTKLWVTDGGGEYNLVLVVTSIALILTGPGAYSLDAALGIALDPTLVIAVAVLALLSLTVALTTKRAPAPQQA